MVSRSLVVTLCIACLPQLASAIDNPAIDMRGYLAVSAQAARHRESRRVSEEGFIRMSREPGTLVLDARSARKFDELHVAGAVNLPFPDIAIESLRASIPDNNTRILIYCNNNFLGAEGPFPAKRADASLNLSTYNALYSYGYRNVYELAPLIDSAKTKLEWLRPRRLGETSASYKTSIVYDPFTNTSVCRRRKPASRSSVRAICAPTYRVKPMPRRWA